MNMKKDISKIGLYIGIGAGLVLFALCGLLPGSFIGGSIGVNLAKAVLGGMLETSLLPRLILVVSMLIGVLVSGILFIISTSSIGWLIGYSLDVVLFGRTIDHHAAVDTN
jgi:hypothetical protein